MKSKIHEFQKKYNGMSKKLALIAIAVLALSCKKESQEQFGKSTETTEVKTPEALGKEIFEGKGNCVACHQVDKKIVGPSIKEIVKIYKEKNGNIVSFLKGEGEAIVDPSQFDVMKTNLEITKTFTDEELQALSDYIVNQAK